MGVINCFPLVGMTDDEVKVYLDNVPNGLNPLLWDQAKKNNPNPKKLIPVQIMGFQGQF
jgi:nuclear pore complex protein Nup54